MLKIGCHLSAAKGFYVMGKDALRIGANTFQFFTRNPRGSKARKTDPADAAALRGLLADNRFAPLIAHAPYTMNPCSKDPGLRELAQTMMTEDLRLLELLPGNYYNFHPGSHVGQGVQTGIEEIAAALNRVLSPGLHTTVLLETMAGKGSEVGSRFEELRAILDRVELSDQMGICLDTCHVFDAGYDIKNDLDGVLAEFDRILGRNRLRAIHLNDSMNGIGSHKDRHARIGEGCIGLEALVRIVNHPLLRELPFCLETPNELEGHAEEIRVIRNAYREEAPADPR